MSIISHPKKDNLIEFFFPCYLIAIGIVACTGIEIFGSAFLESAPWKQNVLFSILILVGMLPPNVRNSKASFMIIGYTMAFFMFGGANIVGTVGLILGLIKVALPILLVYQGLRLWYCIKDYNKWIMLLPIASLVIVFFILPIKDENIFQGAFGVIANMSTEDFSSDHGFHLLLGALSIVAGIADLIIAKRNYTDYVQHSDN